MDWNCRWKRCGAKRTWAFGAFTDLPARSLVWSNQHPIETMRRFFVNMWLKCCHGGSCRVIEMIRTFEYGWICSRSQGNGGRDHGGTDGIRYQPGTGHYSLRQHTERCQFSGEAAQPAADGAGQGERGAGRRDADSLSPGAAAAANTAAGGPSGAEKREYRFGFICTCSPLQDHTPSWRTEGKGGLKGIGLTDPRTATVDAEGHFDALI